MVLLRILQKFESWQSRHKLSLWRTVYFNLRTLPFQQAIKLPILIFGKMRLANLDGDVCIKNFERRIKIGYNYAGYRNTTPGRICLMPNSKLILHPDVRISQGANILCYSGAMLELKECSSVGDNTDIICYKHIVLGRHSDLTWRCQMMDFNSHFIIRKNNEVKSIFNPVIIGDYCWIGNQTTIMPATKLPDRVIVTSNSLLNKDYTKFIPSESLIGGQPAKLIAEGLKRIYNAETESLLFRQFICLNDRNITIPDGYDIEKNY